MGKVAEAPASADSKVCSCCKNRVSNIKINRDRMRPGAGCFRTYLRIVVGRFRHGDDREMI